eukprot:TCONS_00047342-protein
MHTLKSGKRPLVDTLHNVYKDSELVNEVADMVKQAWNDQINTRPTMQKVVSSLEEIIRKKSIEVIETIDDKAPTTTVVVTEPPVRPKREKREEVDKLNKLKALEYITKEEDPEYIEKLFIGHSIGFGVFAKRNIKKGEFVASYEGERITHAEGSKRLQEDTDRSYLYFVAHKREKFCIDASKVDRLGRYINDSKNHNCVVKTIENSSGVLCVAIFAASDIAEGREFRYDYNDCNLFWRKQVFEALLLN